MKFVIIFLSGTFSEMSAGTEKGQFGLGYLHKFMMKAGVHFRHKIHSSNLVLLNK